jgi:hypothetical protein
LRKSPFVVAETSIVFVSISFVFQAMIYSIQMEIERRHNNKDIRHITMERRQLLQINHTEMQRLKMSREH